MKKFLSVALTLCMLLSLFGVLSLTASAESVAKDEDFFIADGVLLEYTGNAEKVVIPNTVTEIDNGVFNPGINEGSKNIKTLVIPNTVVKIGGSAFRDLINLTSVTIPNSVQEVGNHVFAGCTALKSIAIPGSIKIVSQGFVTECSNLEKVEIGYGVEEFKFGAFGGCFKLKQFIFPETVTAIAGQIIWFGADAYAIQTHYDLEMIICNPECELGQFVNEGSNPLQEGIVYPIRGFSLDHNAKNVSVTIKTIKGGKVEDFYKNYDKKSGTEYLDTNKNLKVANDSDNPYYCIKNTLVFLTQDQISAMPENKPTFHPAGKPAAPSGGDTSTDTPADDPNNSGASEANGGNKGNNDMLWLIIIIAVAVVLLAAAVVLFILIKKGVIGGAKAAAVDEIPVEEETAENIEE